MTPLAVLLALPLLLPKEKPLPRFESGTEVIHLDVTVTRHWTSTGDLTAEDHAVEGEALRRGGVLYTLDLRNEKFHQASSWANAAADTVSSQKGPSARRYPRPQRSRNV